MVRRSNMWRTVIAVLAALLVPVACGSSGDDGSGEGGEAGGTPASAAADGDGGPTDGEPVRGGEIVVGMEGTWPPLDTLTIAALAERSIGLAIYDTLLTFDEDGTVRPWLATDWSTKDEGQTWTITLREGVEFHDGTPLDAAAVKAHFDRVRDPANSCYCLGDVQIIEEVEAVDATTVEFRLSQPYGAFPAVLADYGSMIESPTAVASMGKDFASQPVGSGPFRFVSQVTGDSVVVERFEEYWNEELPYLDRITFKNLPDTDARFAALRAGDIDLMRLPNPEHIEQASSSEDLQVVDLGGLGTVFVMFNTQAPPFDDVRVRRAVIYASDMDTINETIYRGQLEHSTSFFPPGSWANSEVSTYPKFDPEEARRLVEEVGGVSFTLTITADRLNAAQALQDMWADVGIRAEIETMDQATSVARAGKSEFQAHLYRNPGRYDPDLFGYTTFHSTAPRNYVQLVDPEVDRLLEEARAAVDQGERAELYAKAADRIGELGTHDIMHATSTSYLAQDELKGIPSHADWVLRTAGIWLAE